MKTKITTLIALLALLGAAGLFAAPTPTPTPSPEITAQTKAAYDYTLNLSNGKFNLKASRGDWQVDGFVVLPIKGSLRELARSFTKHAVTEAGGVTDEVFL